MKNIIKVYVKDIIIKDAAAQLKINYSTAKTILRVFRKEKRLERKNKEQKTKKLRGDKLRFVVEKNTVANNITDFDGGNFSFFN